MEPFTSLSDFYLAIANDVRIGPTHVSLYMALLQQWNVNGGNRLISIDRTSIMRFAKIGSRHTYNKCMNDLQDYGYITYAPSSNAFTKSIVSLKNLSKKM